MRQYVTQALGGIFPFARLEEMGRNNMTMLQRAVTMFNPFVAATAGRGATAAADSAKAPMTPEKEISELKAQLDQMRQQLEELARKK
jgi:polyhydroxyalkanoate synthesis regulator protein